MSELNSVIKYYLDNPSNKADESDNTNGAYIAFMEGLRDRQNSTVHKIRPITIKKVRKINLDIPSIPARQITAVQRVRSNDGIVVRSVRPYSKRNRSSTYWADAGWERNGNSLIGFYTVGGRIFPGSIELSNSKVTPANYFVYLPSDVKLTGPHRACFMYKGKVHEQKKYWIHFSEDPADIDSGIIQIQRDLTEAIRRK